MWIRMRIRPASANQTGLPVVALAKPGHLADTECPMPNLILIRVFGISFEFIRQMLGGVPLLPVIIIALKA